MVAAWRSKSNEAAMETLNEKIQDVRDIVNNFSQPINVGSGNTLGTKGKGTGSGAFGNTSGNQIFNPTVAQITSYDQNNVDQSIFERLNITSRYMIVTGDDPTDLDLKWIQYAIADGQSIYLQPENGKTLHLQPTTTNPPSTVTSDSSEKISSTI